MKIFSAMDSTDCKNILVIHDILPHFDCSGCDLRIVQVLRCLIDEGCHVSYFARSPQNEAKYLPPLKDLGVEVYYDLAEIRTSNITGSRFHSLDSVLSSRAFHLSLLFNWFWSSLSVTEQYLDEIRRCSPQTIIAVLTDDQHWLREQQSARLSGSIIDAARSRSYLKRETECYESADLVLTITEEDRLGLLDQIPQLTILVLPFAIEPWQSHQQNQVDFQQRSNFLFLGGSGNRANQEAIVWFCREVWPSIIDSLPDAQLHIAGFGMEDLVSIERWIKNVKVLGHVSDLEPLFQATRVFVCPVLFGTGLKTKNLISMHFGVPLVTTTVGAVGMALTDEESALVASTAQEFSEKAIALYTDAALWKQLATQGEVHLANNFSIAALSMQIRRLLQHAETATPKAFDPEHRFTVRISEANSIEATFGAGPFGARSFLKVTSHMELARRLISEHRPLQARDLLYDLFAGPLDLATTAWVCRSIELCCKLIGDYSGATEWHQEAESITYKIVRLEMAAKRTRF